MKRQIPNILSVIRLLMIPLFVVLYFEGYRLESDWYCITAAAVFTLASFTDILDGWLARKYNWITPAGKVLDPLADKLMQITVLVCIALEKEFFVWLLVLLAAKETAMLIGAVIVLKKKNDIVVSDWFGKLATVIIFVICNILVAIRNTPDWLNVTCAVVMATAVLFALAMYYFVVFKGKYGLSAVNNPENTKG